MVLTLQQDKIFLDKPSIYQIVQYHPPSASHRILKSLGLEKVREALENLSLQKGKVLEFKPKKTEGLKAPLKTKSRLVSRHLPKRHRQKSGWSNNHPISL